MMFTVKLNKLVEFKQTVFDPDSSTVLLIATITMLLSKSRTRETNIMKS